MVVWKQRKYSEKRSIRNSALFLLSMDLCSLIKCPTSVLLSSFRLSLQKVPTKFCSSSDKTLAPHTWCLIESHLAFVCSNHFAPPHEKSVSICTKQPLLLRNTSRFVKNLNMLFQLYWLHVKSVVNEDQERMRVKMWVNVRKQASKNYGKPQNSIQDLQQTSARFQHLSLGLQVESEMVYNRAFTWTVC